MLNIEFQFGYSEPDKRYVLAAKIHYKDKDLYIWDTTIEEACTKAMELTGINTNVWWNVSDFNN